jgi:hypothetical protein
MAANFVYTSNVFNAVDGTVNLKKRTRSFDTTDTKARHFTRS